MTSRLRRRTGDALRGSFCRPIRAASRCSSVLNEKGGVTHVDYTRADRAPLLILIGEIDHVVPPAIGKAIVKKYASTGSPAIVEYKEFPGRTHRIVSQDGWEEVADYALEWAVSHARVTA